MKTNQIMIRPMGMFSVEQRTKDGFFNATSLLKAWNKYITDNEDFVNTHKIGYFKKKDLDDFFANKGTKVFLQALTIVNILAI